jgi:hypothetical protein
MENQYKIRSPFFYAIMRLMSNRAALVSGVLLSLIVLMAIFAPLITKTRYEEQKFLITSLVIKGAKIAINTIRDNNTPDTNAALFDMSRMIA